MFTNPKHLGRWLAIAVAIGLVGCPVALAAKPPKPPPEPPPRFSVLELPLRGDPVAISDVDACRVVTVGIQGADGPYTSAAFARVDATTRTVLGSGFLPEPLCQDPNGVELLNGPSELHDVNDSGAIVGWVEAYDETLLQNRGRAILWTFDGENYTYELLPCSLHSAAYGINDTGDIAGAADGGAVLWNATTHDILNLNSGWTAEQGWQLDCAADINDDGLIAGVGTLNGAMRGFILDRASETIEAVPLVGSATSNYARGITALGHVIGNAFEGQGVIWGTTDPDYERGFYWDGFSTPVILTPLTDGPSLVRGMNDYGASVGSSVIPNDNPFALQQAPTLWEFDAQGDLVATDLNTQISSDSNWYLWRTGDVNNDGWVSVYGRKSLKGRDKYYWRAVLLVPSAN